MRHLMLCLALPSALACTKGSGGSELIPIASPSVSTAPAPAGLVAAAAPSAAAGTAATAALPPAGLDAAVRSPAFDVVALLAQNPGQRDDVLAALDRCLRSSGAVSGALDTLSLCLERMARIDRGHAARVANMLPLSSRQAPQLADLVLALILFPTQAAMVDELRGIGMLPAELTANVTGAATPAEVLTLLGRSRSFDNPTAGSPVAHDALLRRLAPLGAPALDGVLFEQLPPTDNQSPYRLRAYAAGKRYEVEAKNLGTWYDAETVLGLLNALLVATGSEQRLAALVPHGKQTTVILGTAAALNAAQRGGLLRLANANAARSADKAVH